PSRYLRSLPTDTLGEFRIVAPHRSKPAIADDRTRRPTRARAIRARQSTLGGVPRLVCRYRPNRRYSARTHIAHTSPYAFRVAAAERNSRNLTRIDALHVDRSHSSNQDP